MTWRAPSFAISVAACKFVSTWHYRFAVFVWTLTLCIHCFLTGNGDESILLNDAQVSATVELLNHMALEFTSVPVLS